MTNNPPESDENCAKCFKEGYETGFKDAMTGIQKNEFPAWRGSKDKSGVPPNPWSNFPITSQDPKFPIPGDPNQNPSNPFSNYPYYPPYPQLPFPNYPSIPPSSPFPNFPVPQNPIKDQKDSFPKFPPANFPFPMPNLPFYGPAPADDGKQTQQPSWRSPIISYPQPLPNFRIMDLLVPNKKNQKLINPYQTFNYQEVLRFSPIDMWNMVQQMNQMNPYHNQHEKYK